MTIAIYLAHLNPVTKAHVEIIEELKEKNEVRVMPVVFINKDKEINSKSFPFGFRHLSNRGADSKLLFTFFVES